MVEAKRWKAYLAIPAARAIRFIKLPIMYTILIFIFI
jgi:hypothetical protein